MKAKIVGQVLSILVIFNICFFMSSSCLADEVQDARDTVNSIQSQIEENEEAISAVEDEVAAYLDEIEELENEISTYTTKLEEIQTQIDTLNSQIEQYQSELQNSSQLYNSAEEVYTTRIRAIYENGIPSVFEILISSDGISDFFSRLSVYSSVLQYDQTLISNMKTQKEYVDSLKSDIEDGLLAVEQLSYDLEKTSEELQAKVDEKQETVDELNESSAMLLAATKILEEEKADAEAELQSAIAAAEAAAKAAQASSGSTGTVTYFSGIFVWPTTSSYITASFGYYNVYGYVQSHSGTDIGVSIGSSVYAAASGTVLIATTVTSDPNGPYTSSGAKDRSYSASNGYGYGNYILIDHGTDSSGNRLYTLYGHLSTVSVTQGQTVTQGQVIGYSGNTGNSTGAHLHFEVRVNGTAVDPMSYFN